MAGVDCTFSTVIIGKRYYVDLNIPRNPVSLTVSRVLDLNQYAVLAIYYTTLSSCSEIGWILLWFAHGYEKLDNISF